MNVILIKDDLVENVIVADSVERAQFYYPQHLCLERTEELKYVGPGYTYIAGVFTPPAIVPPTPVYKISRLAFLSRFTDTEAINLDLASIGATVQAATVRRYLSKVNSAEFIDLERADTRNGVLQLEELGFLAAGRALQILNTPAADHEVYKGAV